jgi:hypothetical protein
MLLSGQFQTEIDRSSKMLTFSNRSEVIQTMDSRVIGIILVVGMVVWAAYKIWQAKRNQKRN